MTTTKPLDILLPFNIKKEKCDDMSDDETGEADIDDCDSISSLLQPSILDSDCFSKADPKDEFLHLISMVRRVYFSYLHKSIINNYNVCCTTIKDKKMSRAELKKCASLLELNAVRASLETSLYRQSMLKIISDIKKSTNQQKIHNKLVVFLDTSPTTVDVGVQTSFDVNTVEGTYSTMQSNTHSIFNTGIQQFNGESKLNNNFVGMLGRNAKNEAENESNVTKNDMWDKKDKVELPETQEYNNESCLKNAADNGNNENINIINREVIANVDNNIINTSVQDIFGDNTEINEHTVQNDDQETRDSIVEHLENMFCESDDSSDLMTLIERHSGVTKSNIDKEISKMCSEPSTKNKTPTPNTISPGNNTISPKKVSFKIEPKEDASDQQRPSGKRKLSFSNYKKLKRRAAEDAESSQVEDSKQDSLSNRKKRIWFVERIHQVTKLKNKMTELSIRNYRKHGRVRVKFSELFGESDDEEMMPESPIHIEEHLNACKERIAPWVVKYLMPYYSSKVIQDRQLFKTVAKHIADMLIIENTFPEEECVSQYIRGYFRNKISIKSEADIYV